mgnify:CR=1 FL=1
MANTLTPNVGNPGSVSDFFYPIAGAATGDAGIEANVEIGVRLTMRLRYLYCYVITAPESFNCTITLRKSGADTSRSVTYNIGQSGIKENNNSAIDYAVTDEVNYYLSTGGDAIFTLGATAITLIPTLTNSNSVITIVASRGPTMISVTSAVYNAMNGQLIENTTENPTKFSAGQTFTAKKFYVYVSSNTGTDDCRFGTRVNGVDGNMTVTYLGGQTGAKEDASNTDSIGIGDDFNYYLIDSTDMGFSLTMTVEIISCHLVKTTNVNGFSPIMASSVDGVSILFNTTTYAGCAGDLVFDTIEASTQVRPRFSLTAQQLGSYVTTNTITTSATVVRVRDNGVDSAVTVSYNAGQTGLKTDNTNKAGIRSGLDQLNYKVVTPNTSGSITFSYIGLLTKQEQLSKNLFIYQSVNRASTY